MSLLSAPWFLLTLSGRWFYVIVVDDNVAKSNLIYFFIFLSAWKTSLQPFSSETIHSSSLVSFVWFAC